MLENSTDPSATYQQLCHSGILSRMHGVICYISLKTKPFDAFTSQCRMTSLEVVGGETTDLALPVF